MDRVTDTPESDLIQALVDALQQAQEEHEDNTITTREFGDALGIGINAARRRLRKLQAEGIVKPERITRINDWGSRQTIPGWRYMAD